MSTSRLVDLRQQGAVAIVRMVNEKTRNSLSNEMRVELSAALAEVAADEGVRAVYLTGSGGAFCSGGDLKNLSTITGAWGAHRRFRRLGEWLLPFLRMEKPVVVGVNGVAVGGGMGLAFAGDLIVASHSAKFMAGFFRVGVCPDVATMYTLPRLVGMARAKQFLFGNATWSAQDAFAAGLVAQVVGDDELDAVCMEKATALAQGPAGVIGIAKLIMARSFETGLDEMFLYEGFGQALAMSSGEFKEGLNALLEKRPARFSDQRNP
ncbi:MAG: enoyl-CoA hydratase/isomerase family protein [Burkholderiales bacterium]|nr:enoyl-CoA hydratase/isomerase family protein [Burkholderiales bacterium]